MTAVHGCGHGQADRAKRTIRTCDVRPDGTRPVTFDGPRFDHDIAAITAVGVPRAADGRSTNMLAGRSTESTVESFMTTSPMVVREDQTVAAVAELLAGFEISGLPVVDATDRLVGVISQTDLVRLRGATLPWTGWHGLMVRDLMSSPAKTIAGASALGEAARQMTAAGVCRLVVVDGSQIPIGVISESDLIREIADACDAA
jgi:CBS domain-containing protein